MEKTMASTSTDQSAERLLTPRSFYFEVDTTPKCSRCFLLTPCEWDHNGCCHNDDEYVSLTPSTWTFDFSNVNIRACSGCYSPGNGYWLIALNPWPASIHVHNNEYGGCVWDSGYISHNVSIQVAWPDCDTPIWDLCNHDGYIRVTLERKGYVRDGVTYHHRLIVQIGAYTVDHTTHRSLTLVDEYFNTVPDDCLTGFSLVGVTGAGGIVEQCWDGQPISTMDITGTPSDWLTNCPGGDPFKVTNDLREYVGKVVYIDETCYTVTDTDCDETAIELSEAIPTEGPYNFCSDCCKEHHIAPYPLP